MISDKNSEESESKMKRQLRSIWLTAIILSSLACTTLSASIAHADQVAAAGPKSTADDSSEKKSTPQVPEAQWAFSNMLALRYNPLGLQNELYLGYKKRLYNLPQDNLLFGKSYWWAGVVSRVSPQFLLSGLFFRASPIAVLELQGVFSRVQGLADAAEIPSYYTAGTIDAVKTTQGPRTSGGLLISDGWQGSFQARVQAKVKNIAVRSTNLFRYFGLNSEGAASDDLFYDQTLDLVTPLKSWVYQCDNDLLYADSNRPWVLGARHTYATSLTEPSSTDVNADNIYSIHRAGFLFAWKFKASATESGLEAKKRHALIVLSQWHLDHRFRTGQSMNIAIPYFAVVYSFSGRLNDESL